MDVKQKPFFKISRLALLALMLLSACQSGVTVRSTPSLAPTQTATRSLPTPRVEVTRAPDTVAAIQAFLKAWQSDDSASMYQMLSSGSQGALTQDQFTQQLNAFEQTLTLKTLEFNVLSNTTNPNAAQVVYQVTYHTYLAGDFTRTITAQLSLEGSAWKLNWDSAVLMPELANGNKLAATLKRNQRGALYDQFGNVIAEATDIVSLGVIKGETNPEQQSRLVTILADLTNQPADWVKAAIENDQVYSGAYIPIGEAHKDQVHEYIDTLTALDGVTWREYSGRLYEDEGIAPHVTGYVQALSQANANLYQRQGFALNDRTGQMGIEKWGEAYLTGAPGIDLSVVDAQGNPVSSLKHTDPTPAQNITLTIDADLQREAQRAMSGITGGLVVMERDTGRVLAMVSSPGFDPNGFECGDNGVNNIHCSALLQSIGSDNRQYNRATGSGYPLGSVFKIISMAAALESGLFTPESTLDCQYEYNLDGTILHDWTEEKGYKPSGMLTLPEGLMRSCNPWFYHIGEVLYKNGHQNDIANMARAFGLGSVTGIEGIDEQPGNIPDPASAYESALIAIGQSTVQVNPLQVARFVAAVGNGGTLYQPQLVEKIGTQDGSQTTFTFQPKAQSTLPVSPEHLKVIQDAMRSVVNSPRGTAVEVFGGIGVPVYGKTGTAQVDFNDPNAWFAGYTNAHQPDKPDISFAVIAEKGGEGSEVAAPIARRLLEVYFRGQPQKLYPWEGRINATITPTPTAEGSSDQYIPAPQNTPVPPDQGGGENNGGENNGGENSGDNGGDNGGGDGLNVRTATPSP